MRQIIDASSTDENYKNLASAIILLAVNGIERIFAKLRTLYKRSKKTKKEFVKTETYKRFIKQNRGLLRENYVYLDSIIPRLMGINAKEVYNTKVIKYDLIDLIPTY